MNTKKPARRKPATPKPQPTKKPTIVSSGGGGESVAGNPRLSDLAGTLLALVTRAGDTPDAQRLADLVAPLQHGPVAHSLLIEIRDTVTRLAGLLRTQREKTLAREFSVANRTVRRAERTYRKGSRA